MVRDPRRSGLWPSSILIGLVFLTPVTLTGRDETPQKVVALKDLKAHDSLLSFKVVNPGTTGVVPDTIRVRGLDAAAAVVFRTMFAGAQVSAGSSRVHVVELPPHVCSRIAQVVVDVRANGAHHVERLAFTSPFACANP